MLGEPSREGQFVRYEAEYEPGGSGQNIEIEGLSLVLAAPRRASVWIDAILKLVRKIEAEYPDHARSVRHDYGQQSLPHIFALRIPSDTLVIDLTTADEPKTVGERSHNWFQIAKDEQKLPAR